jgi:hypothetical protein
MPYINKDRRIALDGEGGGAMFTSPGELNYVLSQEIQNYLLPKGVSYTRLNDVIGVLECLKLEIYRRMAAPYEDIKIKENGDVFSRELLSVTPR